MEIKRERKSCLNSIHTAYTISMRWSQGLSVLVLLLIFITGCNKTSQERINLYEQAMDKYQLFSTETDTIINQTKLALQAAKDALSVAEEPDLVRSITKNIIKLEEKLDNILQYKIKADELIKVYKQKITDIKVNGDINFGDELKLIGEGLGVASKSLPPPFNIYGLIGSLVLTSAGGYFGGKKRENSTNTRAAKLVNADIVNSVDKLLSASTIINDPEAAKDVLRSSQKSNTRKVVTNIKDLLTNAV